MRKENVNSWAGNEKFRENSKDISKIDFLNPSAPKDFGLNDLCPESCVEKSVDAAPKPE